MTPWRAAAVGAVLAVLAACSATTSDPSPPPVTAAGEPAGSGQPSSEPRTAVAPTGAVGGSEPPTWEAVSPTPTSDHDALPGTPSAAAPTYPGDQSTATPAAPRRGGVISRVTADDLGSSWHPGCPVPPEQLRAVDVDFWGYDGQTHRGRVVVAAAVAPSLVRVLDELFEAGFPIERMVPIDAYGSDDDASMAANNTTAFNCRAVTGGASWSEHSYGRAIDVNPLVNPYVRDSVVLPPAGTAYADRSLDHPGMIHAGDVIVRAFAAQGWAWGGSWGTPKDYQHFSTTDR